MILKINNQPEQITDHVIIQTDKYRLKITENHDTICGYGTIIHNNMRYNGFFSYRNKILHFCIATQFQKPNYL